MHHTDILTEAFDAEVWQKAEKNLVAKILSEFMYEELISPQIHQKRKNEVDCYLDLGDVDYHFEAKSYLLNDFRVLSESIGRREKNEKTDQQQVSAIQFLMDVNVVIGMSPITLGHLIKELNHTLLADAHIIMKKQNQQEDIIDMDYARLEGEMEGHPWITYNKGRIGFSYDDYLAYAPERKQTIKFNWIAVHKSKASFQSEGSDFDRFIRNEIGHDELNGFQTKLKDKGLNVSDYFFMPVHEWQWKNVLIPLYGEDIANRFIVPLQEGADDYLPQQSIRTFVNDSDKQKHHVKLPMSILNTLVYRGLPSERTKVAPFITDYIQHIKKKDAFLRDECRVILPGEVASINYDHPYFSKVEGVPYQYLELLGCIWRESLHNYTEEGEKPITLAALLHVDGEGKPSVSKWIEASGMTVEQWMDRLFQVSLPPLLHYLYQYGMVFSPHGQNMVLILKDHIPTRVAIKDFVDDVNISDQPLPEIEQMNEDLKDVLLSEPPEGLCQFIFTGLFVCHFRYLSHLLDEYHDYSEYDFWRQVRNVILDYQKTFPHLQERFELFDLLKPTFTKLCLNRNRLLDYGYKDEGERPHASLYGKVRNPLYEVTVDREKVAFD